MAYNSIMSANPLGLSVPRLHRRHGAETEYIIAQRPLRRVLAFLGRSIDDLINDPIVRNEVTGYYKLQRQVDRHCEVVDLERSWNPHAMRF